MTTTLDKINSLKDTHFEQWPNHGITLSAVSAGADGLVRSGILSTGQYFHLKHSNNFTHSEFVWGNQFFNR